VLNLGVLKVTTIYTKNTFGAKNAPCATETIYVAIIIIIIIIGPKHSKSFGCTHALFPSHCQQKSITMI
jgi:hypothetical protein